MSHHPTHQPTEAGAGLPNPAGNAISGGNGARARGFADPEAAAQSGSDTLVAPHEETAAAYPPLPSRATNDGPWCWQNKAARRLIRQRFSELNCVSSALGIYDALCELASDEEAEVFEVSTPEIAKTAGVGTRTAQSILPKLKAFGLIDIEEKTFPGTNMSAPSAYMLLKIEAESKSSRNGCAPVSNNCVPVRNDRKQSSLRTSEESGRTEKEESGKKSLSSPSAAEPKFSPAAIEAIYQAYPRKKAPIDARKAIAKHLGILAKRGTPEPAAWLLTRVQAYAKSRQGEDAQFTPYPASWFNAGSYDETTAAALIAPLSNPHPADWTPFLDHWFGERPNAPPDINAKIRALPDQNAVRTSRFDYLLKDYRQWKTMCSAP